MFTIEHWIGWWVETLDSQRSKFLIVLLVFIAAYFIEQRFGAERGQTIRGRGRNVMLAVVYLALGFLAYTAFFSAVSVEIGVRPDQGILTGVLFFFAYMLLSDFIYYWYHRAQHSFRFLWAIHELHHSDAELNITTSYRTYWLEIVVQTVLISLPVFLILGGQDLRALGLFLFTTQFFLLFTHANLRLPLGPLTPLLCGPQVHRIHHSRLPEHQDKNFAQYFPFIDVLFGTYWAPKKDEYPPTGTEGLPSDASLLRNMLQPFRIWGECLRGLVKGPPSTGQATS